MLLVKSHYGTIVLYIPDGVERSSFETKSVHSKKCGALWI